MSNKLFYQMPEFDFIQFESEDIMTLSTGVSSGGSDNDLDLGGGNEGEDWGWGD